MKVKVWVAQSCPTLCNPRDCSPPGSSVHGILQARILEWVAIPFSRRSSWPRNWTCEVKVKLLSRVWILDCSLPVSSVYGIFQARILECVAISFSRGSSWSRDRTRVSHIAGRHFSIWATRVITIQMSQTFHYLWNQSIIFKVLGFEKSWSSFYFLARPY